jgi:hypothetical protein
VVEILETLVNDETTVIDMRTPATAPLPVLREPSWDQLVPRTRRRPARRRWDVARLVEVAAFATGWSTLAVMLARWVFTLPVV